MTERNLLYRLNRSRLSLAALLLGIFLILLFCNFNTNLVADDYRYCFSYMDDSRIESVWQIFPSMAAHRHSMNGRVVAHFLAQLFLMLPKAIFNLFNAGFFAALVWLIYRTAIGKGGNNALLLACIFGLIWVLQPEFGQVYLWLDGSVNYLWCAVACMLYLLPWVSSFLDNEEPSPAIVAVYVIYSFIVGAFSENASVALIFMNMLFMFLRLVWDKKKISPWMWLSIISAFLGFVYMMAAPAESANKSAEFSIAVLFYYLALKKGVNQRIRVLSAIFLLGSLAGHFVLTFAMYCAGRSTFIGLVLLITANALLFVPLFDGAQKRLLCLLCAICLGFTAYWGFVGIRDIQRTHYLISFNEQLITEASANGEAHVQLPRHYANTKYSAVEGLPYLNTEDVNDWPNVYMAKYYGVETVIGYN